MTSPMDDLRQASADVSGVELEPGWRQETANKLTPAVQAVLDAYIAGLASKRRLAIAAALRAAADQVAPSDLDEPRNYLPMAMECQRIRKDLLAIAAELEGAQ